MAAQVVAQASALEARLAQAESDLRQRDQQLAHAESGLRQRDQQLAEAQQEIERLRQQSRAQPQGAPPSTVGQLLARSYVTHPDSVNALAGAPVKAEQHSSLNSTAS